MECGHNGCCGCYTRLPHGNYQEKLMDPGLIPLLVGGGLMIAILLYGIFTGK